MPILHARTNTNFRCIYAIHIYVCTYTYILWSWSLHLYVVLQDCVVSPLINLKWWRKPSRVQNNQEGHAWMFGLASSQPLCFLIRSDHCRDTIYIHHHRVWAYRKKKMAGVYHFLVYMQTARAAVFWGSLHIHQEMVYNNHFLIFSKPKPGGGVYIYTLCPHITLAYRNLMASAW